MPILQLTVRFALAAVFAAAGLAKVTDPRGGRRAVAAAGVPGPLVSPAAVGLPVVELGLAAALLVGPARGAGLGALVLSSLFQVALARRALHGELGRRCHCFGRWGGRVGWTTLGRDLAISAAALFVYWGAVHR